MSGHGKDAVRLCEHVVRQAFGGVVTVSEEFSDHETVRFPLIKLGPVHSLLPCSLCRLAALSLLTCSTVRVDND
jgi:hypothetical protein